MTITIKGRALHYVFKIPDRGRTTMFFKEVLGMKVLRHEEYSEGCASACNGPYDTRWSKTLMGYGPEHTHFAMELAYNYPIKEYDVGNGYIGVTIRSSETLVRAKTKNWPILEDNVLEAPGGYRFYIIDEPQPVDTDPILKVALSSSNLEQSLKFWRDHLHLREFSKDTEKKTVLLGYSENDTKVEFKEIEAPIHHGTGYGRLAFSCPFDQQYMVDELMKLSKSKILIPLRFLEVPGKISIRLMVIADPDGHEICMVDDESFRQLAHFQPRDEKILEKYIRLDETGQLKDLFKVKKEAQIASREI